MDLNLVGRVALVTGSYRGTGSGIARVLAAEGAEVVVHGFEPGQAGGLIEELGAPARAVWGDICTDEGAERVAKQCGPVDILVNNYGVAVGGNWGDDGAEVWMDAYNRNVLTAVRMTRLLVPAMRDRGWGRIVLVSTIGATRPGDRIPGYYAAKGALPAMTVSLARELAGTGVTVNCVSPGVIATPELVEMWSSQAEREGRSTDWGDIERHVTSVQMPTLTGHIATVSDVGELVTFVCSDRARQINGAHLRIDGGAADVVT
ncbi:SDR family NAD(P)-dependent oxidoreductase [Candidatus Poriferisocius sp.]|uniref:SDR family NAD(P)-dependent oxidoreductase n=1 Tax=Candidatus Poriferisocius sp. TaxID=3101276 RepID=UPI003B0133BC